MSKKQQSAVITGVSSGIGRAIARALIEDGWRVFGSVRKQSDAEAVRADLGEHFIPLLFDVTDESAIGAAAAQVRDALNGQTLDGLVNNAGVALAGPVGYIPIEEMERQFDINLFGVVRVTQAFLPLLGADRTLKGKPGRIINMSSVAGKMASPFMSPYVASKHALEGLSETMRREFLYHGIDVVIIGPGAVQSAIWEKANDIDAEQYRDTEYFDAMVSMRDKMQEVGAAGLPAKAIGDLSLKILKGQARKTRYAILKQKFLMWTLPRLLAPRLVDRLVADRFGIKPRKR